MSAVRLGAYSSMVTANLDGVGVDVDCDGASILRPAVMCRDAPLTRREGSRRNARRATMARMAKITLKGNPVTTIGELPKPGSQAPAFSLVKTDLSTASNKDFAGKTIVLNIFPSIDTGTCATSVRTFNKNAAGYPNAVVLCVSKDLPFAHKRFCGAEGIDKVHAVSAFRGPDFGKDYGVTIMDGPLAGLFARAVVVIDGTGKVVHTELVAEIANEPSYDKAAAALR